MRFGLVEAEKANYPVALMCRVVEVSRAGFYAWCKRPASTRALEDQRLRLEVSAIHAASRRSYGSPRVHMELRERGRRVGRKRVARLMRTAGLRGRMLRRFRRTSDSGHAMAIRDSLLARRFAVARANFGWVADITLFVDAGGLAVLGGDPRPVLAAGSGGGSMSERLENKLALDALSTALAAERQPRGGLIHHSDRGSQYASHECQELLASCGLLSSISRKGQLLGQRGGRELFRHAQDRAGLPAPMEHARPGPQRRLRIRRSI